MDDDEVSKFKFGVLKSLEVTNEIAQITKASENLCLYSAMYNALRSSTLREAFSSFNPFCAAKEFVELSKRLLENVLVTNLSTGQNMDIPLRICRVTCSKSNQKATSRPTNFTGLRGTNMRMCLL